MIKLIASDIDGTLLKYGETALSPEVFDLIRECRRRDIYFLAASGRQYASMRNLFAPVQDDISYITENGSLCIHNGTVIKRNHIERELGLRILRDIRARHHCEIFLSCEDAYYVESDRMYQIAIDVKANVKRVEDVCAVELPFLKIAAYDEQTPLETAACFSNKYASEISVATSGETWVDFILPHANKGSGLSTFLEQFHIRPEECVAFGDQQNDIEMLEVAGTSYAMTTAAPGVASHATATTDSVIAELKKLLQA